MMAPHMMALFYLTLLWGTLAMDEDLLGQVQDSDSYQNLTQDRSAFRIDEQRIRANGIIKIPGRHIDIFTDVRDREDVNELATIFDRAVDFWCDYFVIDRSKADRWRISAMVMLDRSRFERAGLYPAELPDFPAGYQSGDQIWLYVQPGTYYTRHLFLHEGTHAFMWQFLQGVGAPWYAEGMAELLAVHRWDGVEFTMNDRKSRRDELPYWGRIKLVKDAVADGRPLSLQDVMAAEISNFRQVNWYAWAWAACYFFDSHPKCSKKFRELQNRVRDDSPKFSTTFWNALRADHAQLNRDWNLFLQEIDYGIDLPRSLISEAEPVSDGSLTIQADRGWQDTGIHVGLGDEFEIIGSGRFVIRRTTRAWESEANGITVEYFGGYPLGRLLAAVVPLDASEPTSFEPMSIGEQATIVGTTSGRLYLKINDSPAERDDNEGSLQVIVNPKS